MPRCENDVYVSCNVTFLWHISYVHATLCPCTIPLNICVLIVVATKRIHWVDFQGCWIGPSGMLRLRSRSSVHNALDFDCNHEVIAKKC